MWHELVLCGIGGRTIAEAKERLSFPEFRAWVKYRKLRGSLHLGMRVERGAALLATLYANAHTKEGGFTLYDFMPHEAEPALTLEQAIKSWA
ncbi:phage tail assembly protein T [Pseudomonas guariconensis]|uniref:phage tail assembly protein T n=1 Tax=Pseudomonas guariconensis TaxID=1288410 RepID=UPI002E1DA1D5